MKRRNEILDIHLDGPMKTTLKSNRSRIPRHILRFIRHRCLSNNFYKVTKRRKNNLEENAFQQSRGRFPHKLHGLE